MNIEYSVIIPLKNEEGNIVDLIEELEPVMKGLNKPWELICVDDGSTDGTLPLLQELQQKKEYLRLLIFSKNYGQSSAFDAGFKAAKGIYTITMDGDRQNDPKDIPKILETIQDCDLVCGIRSKRLDSLHRKVISRSANWIRSRLCKDGMTDNNCSLKAYRTESLKKIKLFEGMHRFLPALFKIEGFKLKQVPVNHRPRTEGLSKYNIFNRSLNTIFDLYAVIWMRRRHLNYQIKKDL